MFTLLVQLLCMRIGISSPYNQSTENADGVVGIYADTLAIPDDHFLVLFGDTYYQTLCVACFTGVFIFACRYYIKYDSNCISSNV